MSLPGHRGQDTHLNASSTSPSFSWARDAHPTPGERPRGRSLLHCAHSSRDADLAGLWESFLHPPHGSVQPPRPFEGLGFSSFLFYSCFFLVVLGWVREGDMVNAAATSAGLPAGLTLPLSPGPSAPNPGDEGGLLTLIPKTRKTGRDLGAQSVTARTKWQALTCNSRKRPSSNVFNKQLREGADVWSSVSSSPWGLGRVRCGKDPGLRTGRGTEGSRATPASHLHPSPAPQAAGHFLLLTFDCPRSCHSGVMEALPFRH